MKPRFVLAATILAPWTAAPAAAVTITAVSAPNLALPTDGVLYPFTITFSGTYDNVGELAVGTTDPIEYRDADGLPFGFLDDPIHTGLTFTVPAAPALAPVGSPWAPISVSFLAGCTAGGVVFGVAGTTGEGPIMNDGYFYFPLATQSPAGLGKSWGYNTVTCVPPPAPPATPAVPMTAVPEPSTLALLGLGFAWLGRRAAGVRRKTRHG